jgi:hypothetical protein
MDSATRHLRAVMALSRIETLVELAEEEKIPTASVPSQDLADVVWLLRSTQSERKLPAPMQPLTQSRGMYDGLRVELTSDAQGWFPLLPIGGLCVSARAMPGRCAVVFDGEAEPRLIAEEWIVADHSCEISDAAVMALLDTARSAGNMKLVRVAMRALRGSAVDRAACADVLAGRPVVDRYEAGALLPLR